MKAADLIDDAVWLHRLAIENKENDIHITDVGTDFLIRLITTVMPCLRVEVELERDDA